MKSLALAAPPKGYNFYQVESFDWRDNVTLTFYTSRGDTIAVHGMVVTVTDAKLRAQYPQDPSKYQWEACGGASATCSSLHVGGVDAFQLLDDFFDHIGSDRNGADAEVYAEFREEMSLGIDLTAPYGDADEDTTSSRRGLGGRSCRRNLQEGDLSLVENKGSVSAGHVRTLYGGGGNCGWMIQICALTGRCTLHWDCPMF